VLARAACGLLSDLTVEGGRKVSVS